MCFICRNHVHYTSIIFTSYKIINAGIGRYICVGKMYSDTYISDLIMENHLGPIFLSPVKELFNGFYYYTSKIEMHKYGTQYIRLKCSH